MNQRLIMLVDDDPYVLDLCRACLTEGKEFRVITYRSAAEALNKIEDDKPDLIISDLMMPVMDGQTFLFEVGRRLGGFAPPLVFLTAKVRPGVRNELLDGGACEVLFKPISPAIFLDQIKLLFEAHDQNIEFS